MNYMIASDIHGSPGCLKKLLSYQEEFQIQKIILLGDLYYSGARNIPPSDYNPKDVVSILNSISDKVISCKGNCESDVDLMVSEFVIADDLFLHLFGKDIFLSHGHRYSFLNVSKFSFDIFIQGHTHISEIKKEGGKLFLNPGSITLPKDDNRSFMILNEREVSLFSLEDKKLLRREEL